MSPYFDPAYFDPTYFDTGAAVAATQGGNFRGYRFVPSTDTPLEPVIDRRTMEAAERTRDALRAQVRDSLARMEAAARARRIADEDLVLLDA